MIYMSTVQASNSSGANFFCPSLGVDCAVENSSTYQGLIENGSKVLWLAKCERAGCNGMLLMEKLDTKNPYIELIRQMLIKSSQSNDANILWRVISEFNAGSFDMMKVKKTDILNDKKNEYPFKFMGYMARHWLPLLAPTRVSAGVVASLVVEHSEIGILLNYEEIRIGLFEQLTTTELYSAAFYIEQEIKRQSSRIQEENEECDALNISLSGLIDYLDRMVFDLGSPLEEIHTITRLLALVLRDGEIRSGEKELLIRKTVKILWLLKDGSCEIGKIEKPKPKSKPEMEFQ